MADGHPGKISTNRTQLPQARRNSRIRRRPAGIEGSAGAADVDDQRGMIRRQRFPLRDRSRFRQRGPEEFEQPSDSRCPLFVTPHPAPSSEKSAVLEILAKPVHCRFGDGEDQLASFLIDAVTKKMNTSRRDTLSLSLRRVILNTIRNPSKTKKIHL